MYAEDARLAQATHPFHGPSTRCGAIAGAASISVMACSDGAALHATSSQPVARSPGKRSAPGVLRETDRVRSTMTKGPGAGVARRLDSDYRTTLGNHLEAIIPSHRLCVGHRCTRCFDRNSIV